MTSILDKEWHLSSNGNDFLTENGANRDKQQAYNLALNTELKEICVPVLHEFTNNETPKTVLQIHKIRNISAPKSNEDSQAAPRMLKISLTDGETYIQALELFTIAGISLKNTPPGTKLLIEKAKICSGFILLTPQNCKVLGGKVSNLIEKWEVTKSVLRNRKNNNNSEDGPPPWVNFGTRIKTGNQENNFKSLSDKSKESKEASEFDQQRQDAIQEASTGAVRKVFSGRVKQTIQVPSANNKKYTEKPKDKKEQGRAKGKTLSREKEVDDRPQKPLEKVSLFAFLEDKLPVSNNQDTVYPVQPTKNTFKEVEVEELKEDYKRRRAPLPKQFEKPDYSKKIQGKSKSDYYKKETISSIDSSQKKTDASADNFAAKPKQSNYNNDRQETDFKPLQNNSYPRNYNYNANNPHNQKSNQYSQQNNNHRPNFYTQNLNHDQQRQSHPRNLNYHSQTNTQDMFPVQRVDSDLNNFSKLSHQKPNDVNHITQEVEKMALNSQFATRSLRQHLNLGGDKRNEDVLGNNIETGGRMSVGDEIMAKYWEDGKYYNATIISITDKTFAVRFKGYGNIEEILKIDCHPISSSNNSRSNFNQQSDRYNRPYSGTVEFRRRNK